MKCDGAHRQKKNVQQNKVRFIFGLKYQIIGFDAYQNPSIKIYWNSERQSRSKH